MSKWVAIFTVDASTVVEVEAVTQEQAEKKAWENIGRHQLCHQCSHELDIGDVIDLVEITENAE